MTEANPLQPVVDIVAFADGYLAWCVLASGVIREYVLEVWQIIEPLISDLYDVVAEDAAR